MSIMHVGRLVSTLLVTVAYFSVILQWLWVFMLSIPPLIKNGTFDSLMQPSQQAEPVNMTFTLPPVITWSIMIILTAFIVTITVIALVRLPKTVFQGGTRVTEKISHAAIPVLTHHKPIPAKRRRELSRRLMLCVQLAFTLLAFLISLFLPTTADITQQIILTLAGFLAIMSAVCFVIAWVIADRLPKKATSRTRSHASRG